MYYLLNLNFMNCYVLIIKPGVCPEFFTFKNVASTYGHPNETKLQKNKIDGKEKIIKESKRN